MYLSWWSVYFPFDPYSVKWYQQKHNSSFGINRIFSFRPVIRLFHCVHPYPYSLKYYHGPLIIVSFFFFYFLLILKNYLLIVVRASKSYKNSVNVSGNNLFSWTIYHYCKIACEISEKLFYDYICCIWLKDTDNGCLSSYWFKEDFSFVNYGVEIVSPLI